MAWLGYPRIRPALEQIEDNASTSGFMNLAIRSALRPPGLEACVMQKPAPGPPATRSRSRIHMIYANPVVVPVNARARDLIKLFQLLAADLADLPIRNQDLTVIA